MIGFVPPTLTRQAFRALNTFVRPALAVGIGNPPLVGIGATVVETTGRTSGLPRPVPLVTIRVADKVVVSTFRSDSQWFANLEADPRASVRLYGKDRSATADTTRGPLNVAVLDLGD